MTTSNGLVVTPHPLSLQGQRKYHTPALLMPGERLNVFLARHDVLEGQQWVVCIGGVEVLEADWKRIKPKNGYLIEARRVPQKQILAIAAIAVLSYFTFGAAGIAGGAFFGVSGAAGWALAGAAYLAGSAVINKLLGPKPAAASARPAALPATSVANNSSSPSYTLQAGKNRARQFEPMGLVLGEPYCIPDLAAQPYTFFANGEQYLWQLFHFGLNCAEATTLRIGQTAIENYAGVSILKEGFASGNTGLPVLSTNVDSATGGLLDAPGAPGPYVVRTSSSDTIVLAVDIEATLYAIEPATGLYLKNGLTISMEYRAVGSVPWLALALDNNSNQALYNSQSRPLRLTFQRTVPAGQYEVRMQKISPNNTGGDASNQVQWSSLKSYQVDNGNYKGQSRLAVQVQATGQLNGSLDEFNAKVVAKPMPFWDGGNWVTATSRANGLSNPGALILMLARGIRDVDGKLIAGLGLPDSEIDIEGLKEFMVFCRIRLFNFDLFLQENTSIGDLIESIAAAGLGSRSEHTGKLGVIWFSDEQPVEGVLNMTTMRAKSFSVDYNTQETADEIEYQYFDRARNNTWKSVRVTAPGVSTPQRTARQPLQGVTAEGHAAILARFSMAQNSYHRKTVSCDVDLEHVSFRRGTVMALSHDLTQWGYGGRVQACSNAGGQLTLTLDDLVPSTSPTGAVTRYIGLRLAGEAQYRILPVTTFTGSSQVVTLASPWPAGVPVPGDASDNPAYDTVWIYDFKSTPGQKLRVSEINPKSNLDGANVQLVPESPEFWDYVWNGAYTPPPNTSLLGQGPPVVTSAVVTEQLARQGNTFYTELTLTYNLTGALERAELWGAVAGGTLQRLAAGSAQALSWRGGLNELWSLQLRTFAYGRVGVPFNLSYAVGGLSVRPADVSSFSVDQNGDARWMHVQPADHLGYTMRWQPGNNRSWGDATELFVGTTNQMPFAIPIRPSGLCTIMIKAVDTSLNESANVAAVVLNLGNPLVANVVALLDYRAGGFAGSKTNASVVGGDLVADADASSLGWDADEDTAAWTLDTAAGWAALTYKPMTFTPDVFLVAPIDNGAQLTLPATVVADSFLIEYRRDGDALGWTVDAEPGWTSDGVLAWQAEVYQPWPGSVPAVTGRYEFKLTTQSLNVQSKVTALKAQLDVDDQFENVGLVNVLAAGTVVPTAKTWRAITGIGLTLLADGGFATTAQVEYLATRLITTRNSANAAVNGSVLATLQGY